MPRNRAAAGFGSYSELLDANAQQQAQQQPYRSFSGKTPEFVGEKPKPATELLGPNQTNVEFDERNAIAAQRLQQALDQGSMSQEQVDQIRIRLGLDQVPLQEEE